MPLSKVAISDRSTLLAFTPINLPNYSSVPGPYGPRYSYTTTSMMCQVQLYIYIYIYIDVETRMARQTEEDYMHGTSLSDVGH